MKTTNAKLNLSIIDNFQYLGQELLELFLSVAKEAIDIRGCFCMALSKSTLKIFLELINSDSRSKSLPWNKIHFFWVDQCCRSCDCKKNSFSPDTLALISRINMPLKNIHQICSEGRSCELAASTYEQTISNIVRHKINEIPKFDLILLRMAPDGHIASLFSDTYAFFETKRLLWTTYYMDARHTRITMTHPVLYAASKIVVLVSGKDKAEMLREIVTHEPNITRYPVHALWPILEKVTWIIERDAAKFLSPSDHVDMSRHKDVFN